MPSTTLVTVISSFHLIVFVVYVITLVSDVFIADVKPIPGQYLSKAIWLTYVDLVSLTKVSFFLVPTKYTRNEDYVFSNRTLLTRQ